MSYHQYGIIDAASYNTFAGLINEIFADTHSGSVTMSTANYGYGQSTSVSSVSVGSAVTAAQWTSLFDKITKCGDHQGTDVTPIPDSVSSGDLIEAYNNYLSEQTLRDVIAKLNANRLLKSISQMSTIAGPVASSSVSWTSGLQFTFQVDFGSWNNARHFFNTGGAITVAGSHVGGTPADDYWHDILLAMGTIKMEWHSTVPTSGAGSNNGFYDLTTSYAELYRRSATGGYGYTNNYVSVKAKLNAAAGTNGLVDFQIQLIDNDLSPSTKSTLTTYNMGVVRSAGAVPYTGPVVSIVSGGFTTISAIPYTGVPLTLSTTTPTVSASVVGADTAETPAVTIIRAGGTAPFTYSWTNYSGSVTFSNPTSNTTTFSKALTAGQIASGAAKITVTDSLLNSADMVINWSMDSNLENTPD